MEITTSFHKAEIYTQCPAQYYAKFVQQNGHPLTHFADTSEMLYGRILMYAIDHTPEETEAEFLQFTGMTQTTPAARYALGRIYARSQQIRDRIEQIKQAGWDVQTSYHTQRDCKTGEGDIVHVQTEIDVIAFSTGYDGHAMIFEIKASAREKAPRAKKSGWEYNRDNNLQLEWNRRLLEYDDGVHKKYTVDRMEWWMFDDWKQEHPCDEMAVFQERPNSKSTFFDTWFMKKVREMIRIEKLPFSPLSYPTNPIYPRCKTCFRKTQCPAWKEMIEGFQNRRN